MKFLTKEWSQQMSKKGFLLSSPQVNPQAAAFSEPFYQTLYQEAQQKHLDLMRKVAALRRKPFQAEREAEQFRQTHQRRVEELRQFLPQEILDQVADVRVLALDVSTQEVKEAAARWCRENRRQAEQVFQTCMDWRKQVRSQVGAQLQDRFSFHDSTVVKVERAPDRLTLFLEDGGYSPVSRVDFLSPRILEEDEEVEGAVWLYEEIHPSQGGNEYHAMLWRENDQLLYFTVFAKDLCMYEEE